MSTQYDNIGVTYNNMKKLPYARVEAKTFQHSISPFIKDANVLDLACGAGFYDHLMLKWGAARVLGVDISGAMVDAANASIEADEAGRLEFQVGDCKEVLEFEGGPFDIVTGVWFLNYAADIVEMTRMFENIRANLKPGGHFVGIVPYPLEEMDSSLAKRYKSPEWAKYGLEYHYTENPIPGQGWKYHLVAHTRPRVEFDTYHPRKSIFERSARDAGIASALGWKMSVFPSPQEDQGLGTLNGFWDLAKQVPICGGLVFGL